MNLAIEKGIPIPKPLINGGRPASPLREAFDKMRVGDSVLVGVKDSGCCLSSVKRNANLAGIKIVCRLLTPDKRRIWRIK